MYKFLKIDRENFQGFLDVMSVPNQVFKRRTPAKKPEYDNLLLLFFIEFKGCVTFNLIYS